MNIFLMLPLWMGISMGIAHANVEAVVKNDKTQRTLWGVKVSPYVRKVIVTLEEKNISYKLNEILPKKLLQATKQEIPEDFSKISPLGKIPAYQENSFNLTESSVIADYLDKANPKHPLRPKCPKADARVSWFIKYGDDTIAPITHKVLFENVVKPNILKEQTDRKTVDKMIKDELPPVLDFLEKTLADGRTWIADTKNFSLADITVVSHLATLLTSGFSLEILKEYPNLLCYVKKSLARKSFIKALDGLIK